MIAYLDSSIIFRLLREDKPEDRPLAQWEQIVVGVVSPLVRVECLRSIDRLRLTHQLEAGQVALLQKHAEAILSRCETVELTEPVLNRAAKPLPTVVGTLDAIHLATAETFRKNQPDDEPPIYMATHDKRLAVAARALGFRVIGA